MAVDRASRTYPLVLKNDPLNVGIVAAFDFAAEDGSTATSNGKDHSGNNRHYVPFGAAPLVVQTAAGKGRDCSLARTSAVSYYDAAGAIAVGLNVGTGDFSIYKRIRTPSYTPVGTVVRPVGRISDGGGEKIVITLYEVASTGAWHWQISFASANQLLWNSAGAPAIPPSTDSILHITRTAGVLKFFVNGVLIKTVTGNVTDILSTTGSSHCVVGNYGSGNTADVITLDEIYWNRGLTDAEVAAHAGNPYAYYDNAAVADGITISTPSASSSHGSDISISGTYVGAGIPTAIEASFNGGAWTVIDADLSGGTFSGVLAGQAAGAGTLSVRWANATTVTASVANVTVAAASISFTAPSTQLSAVAYRMFQRDGSNQASVRVSGGYVGTPTALQYRWKGGSWATLDAAPAANVFDKTITLTGPGQGDLEVRFSNNTAVVASLAAVGVGDVFMVMGQSNNVGMSAAYVTPTPPGTNTSWVPTLLGKNGAWKAHVETGANPFDDRTGATYSAQVNASTPLGSYFGALATKIMEGGVPVAFVPCALGSSSIAAWAVNTATTTLYGAALARATQIGSYKAVIWWQGENETVGTNTQAQHVTALNALVNDWFTRTAKKWFVWAINAAGCGANFQAIHDAIIEVGQTNANVEGYADLDGSFSSSIHYGTVGEINEVATRTFAALNDAYTYVAPPADTTAPVLTGVITPSNVTSSSFTHSCPVATDNVGVVGYESSIDGGTTYADRGPTRTATESGKTASTAFPVRWRAYDAAGLRSAALALTITTLSGLSTRSVSVQLGSATGPFANLTGLKVAFYDEASPHLQTTVRYQSSTETTDASGNLVFSCSSSLAAGGTGHITVLAADGSHYNGPVVVS